MKSKSTIKKLDTIFADLIKLPGKCHRCKSNYRLQCAHIISRRYQQVRWEVRNAVCLCSGCHMYFTYHPLEWELYINKSILAPSVYKALKTKALEYGKLNHKEILEGLQKLTEHHKRLFDWSFEQREIADYCSLSSESLCILLRIHKPRCLKDLFEVRGEWCLM